jgi:hypothetical protein
MKLSLLLLAALPLTLSLGACETLTQTAGDNRNQVLHTMDTNGKEIPTDVEDLLLLNHPSYSSAAPVPNR